MEVYFEECQHENLFRKAWPLTIPPPTYTVISSSIFMCQIYDKLSFVDEIRIRSWYRTPP